MREDVQSMIDRDDHHVATLRKPHAVVCVARPGTGTKPAAVEPDQDRALAVIVERGCPDVEKQTVFTQGRRGVGFPRVKQSAAAARWNLTC